VNTPAIVTIGNFDGVHLGHQMLIRQVVDRAQALGLCSFAVTFDPHPEQVLFPERQLTHLSTSQERTAILREFGIDDVWVCPFTMEIARLEPDEFMRLVTDRQPVAELWVGADFALGRGRKGTIAFLAEMGGALGWGLHMVPPYRLEGQTVSSTAIRTLLSAGAVRGAADLLGRIYSVPGELDNSMLTVEPLRTLPRAGVYEAQVRPDGRDDTHDARAVVLPEPGRVRLDARSLPAGLVHVDFLRRGD
jgi:riboflavin kinase / FMN adenylyltransferase